MKLSWWCLVAGATAAFAGPSTGPARTMAAPHLILLYGDSTSERVMMTTWRENLEFMQSLAPTARVDSTVLRRREYINVGFYWGSEWSTIAGTIKPNELKPEHASQRGRFYFATPISGAKLVLKGGDTDFRQGFPRNAQWYQVSDSGTAILLRHGVDRLRRDRQRRAGAAAMARKG